MKFALFYEIPVARPWTRDSEHRAYKDTVEQAVLGDQAGFHSLLIDRRHRHDEATVDRILSLEDMADQVLARQP